MHVTRSRRQSPHSFSAVASTKEVRPWTSISADLTLATCLSKIGGQTAGIEGTLSAAAPPPEIASTGDRGTVGLGPAAQVLSGPSQCSLSFVAVLLLPEESRAGVALSAALYDMLQGAACNSAANITRHGDTSGSCDY